MSISNQELECVRCGTKSKNITRFKHNLPTCENCKKKFTIWQNGNRLAILLIALSSIATGITLFLLYPLSFMDKYPFGELDSSYKMVLGWFQTAFPFAIVFLVCTVLLFILRQVYGSKPKNYIKPEKGIIFIKSEKDTEWTPYQAWMDKSLHESAITEEERIQFIKKESETQKTIRQANHKKGITSLTIGIIFFNIGIYSLIYGAAVSLPAGFPFGTTAFFTIHLPTSLPLIILGISLIIYGVKKKKH